MDQISKIQQRLRALVGEGDKIADFAKTRALTDEEQKRFDEIQSEMDAAEAELAEARKMDKFQKRSAALRQFPDPDPANDDEPVKEDRTDYNKWPVDEAWAWFRASRSMTASRTLPGDLHEDLRDSFVHAIEQRVTGQGTLIEQDGGFLVPHSLQGTVLKKMFEEGQIMNRCQQVPITVGNGTKWNAVQENSRASGSRYGGITVARVGEAVATSGSKAKFEQVKLELKKLGAHVYFTEEQLEDGPQAMTIVEELLPKAFAFEIEDEIFNGDGASQMKGILNSECLVTVSKETGQAASTILFENIVNMYTRMPASSRSRAVWYVNQDIEPQLFTMSLAVGTGGVPVYLPANGVAGSPYGTLMGRPVIPVEQCATLGTVGDIVLADMSQYLYATKGGLKTATSMHVKFLEGETVMRGIIRNDGKSWWPSALTPANGSSTQSPFVVLESRA